MDANYILEEEQLIRRFQAGDLKAFEKIYDQYWLKLYTLAYTHIGTKEEAEDLVHNLFENLWKKRKELNIRNLTTYLIASVKYLSVAYIKSKINLRKYQEYLIFQEIERSSTVEDIINFSDLQKAVEEAMKKLPEKTVEVFKMSRYEHKTVSEIAKHLNLSEKAVEYHITKSLKVLKERLQDFHQN
ncbi:RNA polymerase sigma factor [Haliscomenobacter sp.]|uniref:RNA polymerase sigma factor n=1 Tax=Haliscomenobacter sp. TaxID=2717303 RepID=UPI00359417AF